MDLTSTPLWDALKHLSQTPDAAFYAPGHKRGQGISPRMGEFLGKAIFQADLPELPELDNLFAPEGVIKEAQALAALTFGAQQTWFLVNGSTAGIIAAILATCRAGDKIILPRNAHSSAIAGLILSGAIPIFINPEYDPKTHLAHSISSEALEVALKEHSDTRAVMMISPTYHGICGDIEAIATLTHRYDIPLIVDEAHGAHFTFHPDLPPSALSAGADISIQSTHKVLGALTQASMLHLQGSRVHPDRIQKALQLVQSTSPNYLLLASLDVARQQMATQGKSLLERTIQLSQDARNRLQHLSLLQPPASPCPGFQFLDPTRLTVRVSWGMSGFEADEILHEQLGVTAELPSQYDLTFIISIGNTQGDIDQLVKGLTGLASQSTHSSPSLSPLPFHTIPALQLSPRDAFFATTETIPLERALQRISAELICPYPPGIPVLMPGEIITLEACQYLQQVLGLGGKMTGCSDPTLHTIQVVR